MKFKIENSLRSTLRKLDSFGKPVVLKFQGEETFKTSYGGLITVVFYLWMVYVSVTALIPVFTGGLN